MISWLLGNWTLVNISQGMAAFAVSWFIQSTLLILGGMATGRLLARRGSAVQFVVYSTTLVAVLICPVITWTLSSAGITHWSIANPRPFFAVSPVPEDVPANLRRLEQERTIASVPRKRNGRTPRVSLPNQVPENELPVVEQSSNAALEKVIPGEKVESGEVAVSQTATSEATTGSPADALVDAPLALVKQSAASSPSQQSSLFWIELSVVCFSLIWVSVSTTLLTRLAIAWYRITKIRRQAVRADAATTQVCHSMAQRMGLITPPVRHTPFLPSPCLAGLFHPEVLLPEADIEGSLQDILIHELAHFRRFDVHWNLLRRVTTCVFWFQPLVWVLSKQMEIVAEEVCDDVVVEFGGNRADYAQRLLDVAEFSAVSMSSAAVAMVSFRLMLARRVARIMDSSRSLSTRASRYSVMNILLLGGCATLITGMLGTSPSTSAEVTRPDSPPVVESSTKTTHSKKEDAADILERPADQAAANAVTVADGSDGDSGPLAESPQKVIPGILSAPTPLTGGRRWQMYTKNSGASATNVAWSTDGQRLAIANGLIVRLYNFKQESPEFDAVLAGHTDTVTAVRFNATGDRLATASLDGTVRIWDAVGTEQFVYGEHEDAVQDVSFHPDGLRLASASLDGTVRIWSIDGKTVAVLRDHEAPVNAVAWNPNGTLLASGCENKTIRYWNDQGVAGPVIEAHIGPVRSMAWNADGSQLLSCDFGIEATVNGEDDVAHMKIWNTQGDLVNSIMIISPLSFVAWSPDGTRAVAGGWRSIRIWTINQRDAITVPLLSVNGIVPVAWRPTGDVIAAGPTIVDGNRIAENTIPLRHVSLYSAGLNPDGTILGIGRASHQFDLFTAEGEQIFHSPNLAASQLSRMHSICWSPDGKTFVTGVRYQANLQQYDTKGAAVGPPIALQGDTRALAWSRDGKSIAVGGDRQIVSLVNLSTSETRQIGRQNHGITQVRFTPDQTQICSAGFDGCVRFWSLDGKPLKVLETISAPICSLAWAADGKLMATGHQDNVIRFWDSEGELVNLVGGHGGHIEAVEFNPAGTLLASGSRDNTVRIWKRDGTLVSVLRGHLGTVYGIQWTPDGTGIYTSSEDATVRKWNVETGIAEWQALLGEIDGYVTLNAQGDLIHGDEKILDSDFAFFAEDNHKRLKRTSWTEIRAAIQPVNNARAN